MDNSYDRSTLDFVIRIWLEEQPVAGRNLHWRGHITEVLTGERRYFQDLARPVEFIQMWINTWRGDNGGHIP